MCYDSTNSTDKGEKMGRLLKRVSCTLGIAMILTVVSPVPTFVAEAKEQTVDIYDSVNYTIL